MKILELKPQHLLLAVIIGLCVAGCITYITAPRPVEVPVQVITPVPTPPPVVITQAPQPAPVIVQHGSNGMPVSDMEVMMAEMMASLIPMALLLIMVAVVLSIVARLVVGR